MGWSDDAARNRDVWTTTNAECRPAEYYGFVSVDWARKWPAEEIWIARKR